MIKPAPNREVEARNLRPLWSELSAVWSDISTTMRGFEDHSPHKLVLDEVSGLILSNISRQLKLKPGIDDDHRVIVAMSNDLWLIRHGDQVRRRKEAERRRKEISL